MLLEVLELAAHLLVGDADSALVGLLLERLGLDQELHHLLLEEVVLLLALLLELLGGRRSGCILAAAGAHLLVLGLDALRELGRGGHHDLLRATRCECGLLRAGCRLEPVVELGLLDLRVAHAGHRVRRDVVAARGERDGGDRYRECKGARPTGRTKGGFDELRHVEECL